MSESSLLFSVNVRTTIMGWESTCSPMLTPSSSHFSQRSMLHIAQRNRTPRIGDMLQPRQVEFTWASDNDDDNNDDDEEEEGEVVVAVVVVVVIVVAAAVAVVAVAAEAALA